MRITNLFPMPICQTDLHRELTEDELKFFALEKEKERMLNMGNTFTKNKYVRYDNICVTTDEHTKNENCTH